jgi:TusA-related sulfurtransferase
MDAPELKTAKEPSADRRIDTRGLLCPYPFIEAKLALEALPPGSTVEILTDSEPTATSSIPILCERNGYTYTTTRDVDLWVLVVEKP